MQAMCLINEAHANGARKHKACELLNISLRTLERWEKPDGTDDKRRHANRRVFQYEMSLNGMSPFHHEMSLEA